jgi:hypothetical protein
MRANNYIYIYDVDIVSSSHPFRLASPIRHWPLLVRLATSFLLLLQLRLPISLFPFLDVSFSFFIRFRSLRPHPPLIDCTLPNTLQPSPRAGPVLIFIHSFVDPLVSISSLFLSNLSALLHSTRYGRSEPLVMTLLPSSSSVPPALARSTFPTTTPNPVRHPVPPYHLAPATLLPCYPATPLHPTQHTNQGRPAGYRRRRLNALCSVFVLAPRLARPHTTYASKYFIYPVPSVPCRIIMLRRCSPVLSRAGC